MTKSLTKEVQMNSTNTDNLEGAVENIPRRILNNDGGVVLNRIFKVLQDDSTSSIKSKIEVVDTVLKTMRKESSSLTHCADVISRLCLELPKSPIEHIVRWCDDSIQSIVADDDVNMIWRDVLPECLNVLLSYDVIKHFGTDLSSAEYKQQCIHTLCQCQWKERQLVQLAAMFIDMRLSRNDHKQVVNKICSYIIEIPPDTLPPLVHQLLRLCKSCNIEVVLAHLSHYFSVRLYSRLEPQPQDSESTTMDLDDIIQHSPVEISRCLSTCIYHITQGAADPELIQKHIKAWPKTQLLRAPFMLDVALAVSDKGADFRAACLNVIRSAIEQRIMDEQRCKESAWVRSVLPPDVDVPNMLKVLTTESGNHRDLTVMGLINLAFSLLSTPRTKPSSVCCWSHGKLILVRLCKDQPETAPHVLSLLGDRLAGDCTQRQYAECLYILCKLTPVSVERCSQLTGILEHCQPAPPQYRPAAAVLDAVHPLINFSTRTRDALVMICRKGLFSRDSLHRCLSLSGFLSLLRHVKLGGGCFSSSQSISSDQYSANSYLTQLTVDLHATSQGQVVTSRVRNEIVCMEVVSILRRCFVQDAAVKQLLYTNIYDCVKNKPVLHESILEQLYEHLNKYISEDDSSLVIDKCVQLTDAGAVLHESIAHLLYVIAQFIRPMVEDNLEDMLTSQSDMSCEHLKSRLGTIMEQFCNNGLPEVDMQDPGLTDLTPESKAKCIKVQLTLQCYEALIAHQIMQWNPNSNNASTVSNLQKMCAQLLEQTKSPSKMGKKRRKSIVNETRETMKSQKSQKTQGDKTKGTKLSNLTKNRAGPFKPLPCVWDLTFCLRLLELLYNEEVPWSTSSQYNQLRSLPEFHQWSLRCVRSSLNNERIDKRVVATHVVSIATVLYRRCICRFHNLCIFDDQTALGCLETFKDCLTLLFSTNYSLKFSSFLSTITGLNEESPTIYIAAMLETLLAALIDESTEEHDVLYAALIQTLSLLLEVPLQSCPNVSAVIIKLEEYIHGSKQEWLPLLPALLSAGCRSQQEAPLLDDLLTKLTSVLRTTDADDNSTFEETAQFPIIDSRTGQIVLNHVCVHLMNRFKCVEHVLARARDLTAAVNYAVRANQQRIDTEVKELYKSMIVHLCQVTAWTSRCGRVRCAVGSSSDRAVAACERLYSLLATLARQLPSHVANSVQFESLLKLSGKKLSSVTDDLITYLEGSQGAHKTAIQVLRDTKSIPKMVHAAEQYTKNVILLGSKVKVNYQQYMSLSTARDFRIKLADLQKALNPMEHDDDSINDATTDILSVASNDERSDSVDENEAPTDILSVASNDERSDSVDENEAPSKRRKIT